MKVTVNGQWCIALLSWSCFNILPGMYSFNCKCWKKNIYQTQNKQPWVGLHVLLMLSVGTISSSVVWRVLCQFKRHAGKFHVDILNLLPHLFVFCYILTTIDVLLMILAASLCLFERKTYWVHSCGRNSWCVRLDSCFYSGAEVPALKYIVSL